MTQLDRIFLTGFSGTGKSTVAELVANELGWEALDTDAIIAERVGKSPAEILTSDGEERFRKLEREAIHAVASRENVIVATGGGAVVAPAPVRQQVRVPESEKQGEVSEMEIPTFIRRQMD